MKTKASVKADPSKGDLLVRRKGRLYVINKKDFSIIDINIESERNLIGFRH